MNRPHEHRLLISIKKSRMKRISGIKGLIPFYEVVKIYLKNLVLAIFFV